MRFSCSSCSRCIDVCPQNAISLIEAVTIDAKLCSGCQLCSSVCPGGALEANLALSSILQVLQKQMPIVIACQKASQESHLCTPCLAFISEEFLLALFLAGTPGISLNLTECSECVNCDAIIHLQEVLVNLEARSGLPVSARIKLIFSADELNFQEEACDRRGFFRSLTRSIVSEAASLFSNTVAPETDKIVYADKQLPLARAVLNTVLEKLPPQQRQQIRKFFSSQLLRGESCDGCRACVKVCPTGALLENYDETQAPFEFSADNCTGCGLCVEFCLNEALTLAVK